MDNTSLQKRVYDWELLDITVYEVNYTTKQEESFMK